MMVRILTVVIGGLLAVMAINCSSATRIAGGDGGAGSETTNGIVASVVYPDGTPGAHAIVRLRSRDYLADAPAGLENESRTKIDLLTDSLGGFVIDSLDPGAYLIEVTNDSGASAAFAVALAASDSTIDLGTDTLRADAVVGGAVSFGLTAAIGGVVRIAGLERITAVSASGRFAATVPPGMAYTIALTTPDTTIRQPLDAPDPGQHKGMLFDLSTLSDDSALVRMFLDSMQLGATPVEAVFLRYGSPFVHKRLDLSSLGISAVHPSIGRLVFLTEIFLSRNNLAALPDTIRSLPALYHLYLDRNPLAVLPAAIAECSELKLLDLDSTRITSLPPQMSRLSNLGFLSMDGTGLTQIPPVVFEIRHLATLSMQGNAIETVPPAIGSLARLANVNLAQNGILSLPEEICNLTELTYLYFYSNKLDSVPENIGQCGSLRELRLDENNLIRLPASIGQLTQIEQLGLRMNKLSTLPVDIVNLQPSVMLNVDYNTLCALPAPIAAWVGRYTANVNWRATQQPCS